MANKVSSFQVQGEDYGVVPNLSFDNTPTVGSTNPVTSNGIALAIQSVAIGDNISHGQKEGTPIGEGTIAFGKDLLASGDGSLVMGTNNISVCNNDIIAGSNNQSYGQEEGRNNISGGNNIVYGIHNLICGMDNHLGSWAVQDGSINNEYKNKVYIGYVVSSLRKIYRDPEHTSEIDVSESLKNNGDYCYFLDLTDIGTVYECYNKQSVITILKIYDNSYVDLTNRCNSISYRYKGISYYNAATDKNYSDSSMTDEITPSGYGHYEDVYFDVNDGSFIRYNNRMELGYSDAPSWARIIVYRGINGGSTTYGTYAYVDTSWSSGNIGHVYTSSDLDPLTDITDTLYDGECVIDILSGKPYFYGFDINHNLVSWGYIYNHFNRNGYSQSGIIAGMSNSVSGGEWNFILGGSNTIQGSSSVCGVFGKHNTISFGLDSRAFRTDPGGGQNFIFGYNNGITVTGGDGLYPCIIEGAYNHINALDSSDDIHINGNHNDISGCNISSSHINGVNNSVLMSGRSFVYGTDNTNGLSSYSSIIGFNNSINSGLILDRPLWDGITELGFVDAIYQKDGTLKIDGVTYDILINPQSSKLLPTDKIFIMHSRRPLGSDDSYQYDNNADRFMGFARSTTGRDLNYICNPTESVSTIQESNPATIIGKNNKYIRSITTVSSTRYMSSNNIIIGDENKMYAVDTHSVSLIGHGLTYIGDVNHPVLTKPGIIIGSYNKADSSTSYYTGARWSLIVGIGTSDSDRKNGFVIMGNGVLIAPECPDTVSEASSVPYDSNKVVVTLGMLRDYAPGTPGAVGRPSESIITLSADSWSNSEQEVSIPDIKSNSIVITQPYGDPNGYYTDRIYLKSQSDGALTFASPVSPSSNILVKVVYWA